MRLPYNNCKITSPFGMRTLNGSSSFHYGVDLVGLDEKIVRAPVDGVVVSSTMVVDKNNPTWQWGNYVRIDGEGYSCFMCHMQSRLVQPGEKVKAGDPVGIEGNTGYSFGAHCHFEVRKGNTSVDPCKILGIKNEVGLVEEEEMDITKFKELFDQMRDEFRDNDSSDYSLDAREWGIKNGIVQGGDPNEFNGMWEDFLTREQMVTLLYRTYNLIVKEFGA